MKIILRLFRIAIIVIVVIFNIIFIPFLTLADQFVCVELFTIIGLYSFASFWCWGCARGERHTLILSSTLNTKELFANYELVLEKGKYSKNADHKERCHQANDQRRIVFVIVLQFAINRNLRC